MGELFDKLAKDASGELSRRQVFGRFGWGLAAAVLASLGLAGNDSDCHQCCAVCCKSDNPPHGSTPGQCIQDCHQGKGQCSSLGQCGSVCA